MNVDTTLYRAWEGRDIEPGQGIVLELTNLPQPSLGARLEKSITDGTFWKVAIPIALGAVFAVLLLFGMLRPGRFAADSGTAPVDGRSRDPADREAVIREIASLDELFQSGDVTETDYRQRRENLVSLVLTHGSPDEGSGESPRTGGSNGD